MDTNTLPANYLAAEAAARPELDRPDHDHLEALLAMGVKECGEYVAANPDVQDVLPRAARILNPNAFVPIGNYPPNVDALMAALESTDPIMRRFASAQYFIDAPRQDTSWAKPLPEFPADLAPDGAVVYVPFVDGAAANTTVASVAAADAAKAAADASTVHPLDAGVPGTIATVTAPGELTITLPDAGIVKQPIAASDPIAVLPVGSTITRLADATKIAVAHPSTNKIEDGIRAIEADVSSCLSTIEGWLKAEMAKL